MKTKLNIKTTAEQQDQNEVLVGEWYKDISKHGKGYLYIVSRIHNNFALIGIKDGESYSNLIRRDINGVFGEDRNDFILVKNVNIEIQ